MTDEDIKQAKELKLRPNVYLADPEVPYNYQKKGVLLMVKRPFMVLGDDVGLGKTLQAVVHFTYIKSKYPSKRCVVLAERVALKQWKDTFTWLAPSLSVRIVTAETHPDPQARMAAFRQSVADVLITTYSMIYKYRKQLQEALGEGFILYADEPNFFKNIKTKLHRGMREFAIAAERRYGLSATIIENRLEEAYGVFTIIAPESMPGRLEFEKEYLIKRQSRQGFWYVVGYKNLKKFRDLIQPYFYGRLQTDPEVLQAIPDEITKDVEIDLSLEQSLKVTEAMERLIETASGDVKAVGLLPSLILQQQLVNDPGLLGFPMASAKMDALIETLGNTLAHQKVVVFSKFRTQVDRIGKRLAEEGIEYTRITGMESEEERNAAKAKFQTSKTCNVILITRAGQRSIDLQAGQHLFFFDLPWSYGAYRQTVGRIKRTGSEHSKIGVYRMLGVLHEQAAQRMGTAKTIDHHALKVVMRKKELFNLMTGDATTIETSPSDLLEILKEIKEHAWKG